MSLVSFPSWGLTMGDLVEREGVYYKKFTDVPFTGEVVGKEQGQFKDGKKHGKWMKYYDSGQLWKKSFHIDGKLNGVRLIYCENGSLSNRGAFNNGKGIGLIEMWDCEGNLKQTYLHQDGKETIMTWYNEKGEIDQQMTSEEYFNRLNNLGKD